MNPQQSQSLAPPFTLDIATQKVRKAEDGWNSRDPEKVALAYTVDSRWRNRAEFVNGREEIVKFLTRKWQRELEYRLIKELWAFHGDRIAVRVADLGDASPPGSLAAGVFAGHGSAVNHQLLSALKAR